MPRNFLVLVNPTAGKKAIDKKCRYLSERLQSEGLDFQLVETRANCRGTQTVKNNLTSAHTDLVILGGDGTINEAINGIDHKVVVSFLPCGTGNDTVKPLNIGRDIKAQLDTIVNGKVRTIDAGDCNGRKFLNGVGVGFDGQIVFDMQQRAVPLLSGQSKYYYHVLNILSSYQPRRYEVQEGKLVFAKDLILLTVAKGTTFGGGFMLTPHALPDDGELAICKIGPVSPMRRFANVLRLQNGSHDKMPEVTLSKAKTIQIGANDLLEGHIDGEYTGRPPFSIRVLPGAVKVRVSG